MNQMEGALTLPSPPLLPTWTYRHSHLAAVPPEPCCPPYPASERHPHSLPPTPLFVSLNPVKLRVRNMGNSIGAGDAFAITNIWISHQHTLMLDGSGARKHACSTASAAALMPACAYSCPPEPSRARISSGSQSSSSRTGSATLSVIMSSTEVVPRSATTTDLRQRQGDLYSASAANAISAAVASFLSQ
jgi:hypothetical protein